MLHFVPITLKHRSDAMVLFLNFRPETAFSITPECTYRMFDPCPQACCVDVTY
jgi:hypothetical protein